MTTTIIGAIVAGGLSRRMNRQDKAFMPLANQPLICHTLARLIPQVSQVVINAPETPAYQQLGYPLIPDLRLGHLGPLAGLESLLQHTNADWLLSVAVDLPFLPADLCQKLLSAVENDQQPVVACSLGQRHSIVALWPSSCRQKIAQALDAGHSALTPFLDKMACHEVDFPGLANGLDPFFNINHPHDLELAQTWIQNHLFS